MPAGQRCPTFTLGAETDQGNIFFSQAELADRETGDEIGARAELAYADFLSLEIRGFLYRRSGNQDVVEFITRGSYRDEVLEALSPCLDDPGTTLLHQVDIP